MKKLCALLFAFLVFAWPRLLAGQNAQSVPAVPRLVNYSGHVTSEGRDVAGITFAIYKDQYDGTPLWLETQNVRPDAKGNYTVQLGATTSEGLPLDLFASGEARWLGVQVNGGEEQPRVLLLSVPYALKAADAQTLGGLPASAFVLAAPVGANSSGPSESRSAVANSSPNIGGSGTQNYLPLWTDSNGDLGNSILYQTGSGSNAKVGVNEKNPLFTVDVNGSALVRGLFEMATQGYANQNKGFSSQPLNIESSAFNSSTQKYTLNHFQWQAEPTGNNTSTPAATLNLLYGTDPAAPAETGLSLNSHGVFSFAQGQSFPGTGTITGVAAGTDLTGGGQSGNVTLNLDTTKVPQLNTANTFTGNQTVIGNLSASGVVSGSSYQIGGNLFAFGSLGMQNAFLGFGGNTTTTGYDNTASGYQALYSDTTGTDNTATGAFALYSITSGYANTASGHLALYSNTTGGSNTASGEGALVNNTTGSSNTATGVGTLSFNSTGDDNTASGVDALAFNTTGYDNTASGYDALNANFTGNYNTASGYQALYSNSLADYNTATGYEALVVNTTGGDNLADGAEALRANTTGGGNTGAGAGALYTNVTGNYLTCVGYYCTTGADGLSNATAVGAHAVVSQSNSLVLGGTGAYAVKVGIGTATPSNILTIARGAGHPVSDSWETYSSRRWKTNIKTLPDALSKVEHLRGVSYDLKDSGKHEIGVIAEEVGSVVPEVVSYEANGKDASGVDYSRLTAVLIEAVKQQQKQIRELQKRNSVLETKFKLLRGNFNQLKDAKERGPESPKRGAGLLAKTQF